MVSFRVSRAYTAGGRGSCTPAELSESGKFGRPYGFQL